jgi:pyrimidine deaminase RibD-like protein
MPLDATARQYSENLFWKRVEELAKQHAEDVRQLKYKYSQNNLPLPGPFFSQYADLLLDYVRNSGDARLSSLIKAYEQSGSPFDEAAFQQVKTETVQWCHQQQHNAIGVIGPLISQTYSSNEPPQLREAITSRLVSGVSGIINNFVRDLEIRKAEYSFSQRPITASATDRSFCEIAVEQARQSIPEGDGKPRPKVGAVVVKNGKVLSSAYRGEKPGNHAEYIALEIKLPDETLAGATVYTTLEPCTVRNSPKVPCADRLIERGVARVWVGMLDPNPVIQGHGVRRLQAANIEVQLFPHDLMKEISELNRDFTREFDEVRSAPKTSQNYEKALSLEDRKIADILRYRGKIVTVLSKQKYGHGYLEGEADAVVIDCDSLGAILRFTMGSEEISFALSQIELSRDVAKNTLKMTIYR